MTAVVGVLAPGGDPAASGELAAMCLAASDPRSDVYRLEARPGIAVAVCGGESTAGAVAEESGVLVAADLRLDNRAELIEALELPSPPADDTALLLAGYRRWGDRLLDRLVGDFAFILWDAAAGRLLCGRDPLGMRALHYARVGGQLLLASEAQQIAAHPAIPGRVDALAIGEYLVSYFGDPSRSFYEGVAALPPGHCLTSRNGAEARERYWRPEEIRLHQMDLEEATTRFSELLWRAVADRLDGAEPVCGVLASGGLDSSALLAIAQDLVGREGGGAALAPFCLTFAGCDESEYWRPLAAHLGIEIEQVRGESYGAVELELRDGESPCVGWQPPFEVILERLRLRRGKALLTGLGGDSVVAGSACVHADRLGQGRLGEWRAMAEHAALRGGSFAGVLRHWGLRPLVPRPMRHHLGLLDGPQRYPDWIERRWAREVGLEEACRARPAEPPFRSRARRAIHSRMANMAGERQAAHWFRRFAARHGIQVRHPFLDRRLVEFILSTPPELLFRAGRYKRLLRRAMVGRLPEKVRQRVGKTAYGPYLDYSFRRRADWLRQLLRAPLLADLGIVRLDRLRQELERYLAGSDTGMQSRLWAIITTELWLRRLAPGDIDLPRLRKLSAKEMRAHP